MNLKKIKNQIEVLSENKEIAAKIKEMLLDPADCFGLFNDDTKYECKICTAPIRFNGKKYLMNELCAAITQLEHEEFNVPETLPEVNELLAKIQERLSRLREVLNGRSTSQSVSYSQHADRQ
jgi:hypothetical protein